jgi:hypothetical protein
MIDSKSFDTTRMSISNNMLIIEPFRLEDYRVYKCVFVDEFGEQQLYINIDKSLIKEKEPSTRITKYTRFSMVASSTTPIVRSIEMADLNFEAEYVPDTNDIRLKCKTNLGIFEFSIVI